MADLAKLVDELSTLTVLEAAELTKMLEEKWGVSAAAPVAVAEAAGLFTSRIDGSPLVYNMRDTWLPDLIVCQQHLAQQVIAALRAGRISR